MNDLSRVERFDLTGVPSRANMIIRMIGTFSMAFLAMAPLLVFSSEFIGRNIGWFLLNILFWMLGLSLVLNQTIRKYERLYMYVRRGVVTEVHADRTSVRVDGYTGANIVKTQKWMSVPPAVWRNAQVGDVIDFTQLK